MLFPHLGQGLASRTPAGPRWSLLGLGGGPRCSLRPLDWGGGRCCLLPWETSALRQMPRHRWAAQDSEARPVSQAGPRASGPRVSSEPSSPVFSLPPLLRQPCLWGLLPWPLASQPAPTLCLALQGSQLPPGCSLPKNIPGPLELITAHTALHALCSRATCTQHPLLLPTPASPIHPVPRPETRESPLTCPVTRALHLLSHPVGR